MIELSAAPDVGAAVVLLVVSFVSYLGGVILHKWPDKVQAYTETIDGSTWLISPQAHRALIQTSGRALVTISFAALFAAAWVL